jgi:uncharacterized protein YndB with AHSA1/START domain
VPPATSPIEHEVTIAADPEVVFSYFTDPGKLVEWIGVEATLDPRPGGVFRLVFEPSAPAVELISRASTATSEGAPPLEATTNTVLGEFVEVDPYERIAFTWGYEAKLFAMPPQASAVEVSLTPVAGETVVRLTHRRIPATAADFHRGGWDHYLPRLAAAASGRDPGRDPFQA